MVTENWLRIGRKVGSGQFSIHLQTQSRPGCIRSCGFHQSPHNSLVDGDFSAGATLGI